MSNPVKPQDAELSIKFGGGLHTRATEDEIDPREAAGGQNFLLDLENRELRPRPPFDLVGTVPNGSEIRGGFSLLKSDGTVQMGIQAGDTVYEWDGAGFEKIGTVDSTAKLRGHWRSHNWTLDDKVIITDMNLVEVVKEWDGSTFQSVSFTSGTDSGASFGNFYAKYLTIADERAIFAHVRDASGVLPHMIVGTQRENYTVLSVDDRPSSSLSEADPFFLLTPDLKPINGLEEAFGTTIISTQQGKLFNLSGSSAKDFAFSDFYAGSAAAGEEAVAYIGNDIIYGRNGRIESVRDTDRFGDSEADDLTSPVKPDVEDVTGWRILYNSRLNRIYAFPMGESEVWVAQTAMIGGKLSPWMRWTTNHAMAFQPTFAMSMLDPADGLEYVFMGDSDGNLYRMEGSGDLGDAGSVPIQTEFVTRMFTAPLDTEINGVEGFIKYHKHATVPVRLVFEYAGVSAFNESINIELGGIDNAPHFGGDHYFGGDDYFGVLFEHRLLKKPFFPPGQASDFQIRVQVDSVNHFHINEIALRFKVAS